MARDLESLMGTQMKLSDTETAYFKMFSAETYGVGLPRDVAKSLEAKGLVEWVPPKFGTTLYGLTPAGRALLEGE